MSVTSGTFGPVDPGHLVPVSRAIFEDCLDKIKADNEAHLAADVEVAQAERLVEAATRLTEAYAMIMRKGQLVGGSFELSTSEAGSPFFKYELRAS